MNILLFLMRKIKYLLFKSLQVRLWHLRVTLIIGNINYKHILHWRYNFQSNLIFQNVWIILKTIHEIERIR